MSTDTVPAFYKFFFLYFDPVCSVWGAYMDFFTPEVVLAAYNPSATHTRELDIVFQQMAGPLLMLVFLDIFLLRYTKDLYIWKLYQFSVFLIDVAMLYSFYDALVVQNRLSLEKLESFDYVNVGITLVAGLVRLAFCAELGYSGKRAGDRKTK